ncbi:MAG: metallophosphoesterase [Oscillospiraceae bacterium]|nr:metallophosphoesterase [Oscillospiraceae bacterium]
MKIIVVSDTHKDFNALKTVVENNLDADLIIHLGDGENEARDIQNIHPELPMIYVQGNCDFGTYDSVKIVTACGFKIFCTHGHLHLIDGQLDRLIADAKQNDCRIVLYGHTHIHRVSKIDGVYVMNPGSLKSPRNQNEPTYGLIEITTENEIKMNIIAPAL